MRRGGPRKQFLLQVVTQSRLLTECERSAHLHAGRAFFERLAQLAWAPIATRKPEWNRQRAQSGKIHAIALAVHGLARRGQL